MKQFGEIFTQLTHWPFMVAPVRVTHTLHLRGEAHRLPVIITRYYVFATSRPEGIWFETCPHVEHVHMWTRISFHKTHFSVKETGLPLRNGWEEVRAWHSGMEGVLSQPTLHRTRANPLTAHFCPPPVACVRACACFNYFITHTQGMRSRRKTQNCFGPY